MSHRCKFCAAALPSRNALFRHLRASAPCAAATEAEGGGLNHYRARARPRHAALLVGYHLQQTAGGAGGRAAEAAVRSAMEAWCAAPLERLTRASAKVSLSLPK